MQIQYHAKPKKILENLFKSTALQSSFGINMVAIAGGKPKQLGLLEIISYYTAYQREIIISLFTSKFTSLARRISKIACACFSERLNSVSTRNNYS